MPKKHLKTNIPNTNIKVEYVDINQLRKAPYNPRTRSEGDEQQLRQSIKRYGMIDPLIVNGHPRRKNIIIGGHFRFDMAKEMEFTTVPVVYINIASITKEKELNLRLNRNQGQFDVEALKKFDINLLLDVGFDDSDLSAVWDDVLQTENDDFDADKEAAAIKNPRTKPGDIFQLGNHLLGCGDATDPSFLKKVIGKRKAHMLYCDPPYNIGLSYNNGLTTKGKYQGHQTNDTLTEKDYAAFLAQSIQNALSVAHSDTHVFYWCDEASIALIQRLFSEHELANRRVCLWLKNNFNMTPQVAFNKVYEPCAYATRGKPYLAPNLTNLNEVLNKEVGTGNRLTDDVLDLLNIWLVNRVAAQDYEHPTQKPPTLHEKALRRCTKPGDLVLDLFGGSGSTLIACEQMKRKSVTIELEPVFCDVIIKRFESSTKSHAKKIN